MTDIPISDEPVPVVEDDRVYLREEAAQILRTSTRTVDREIADGKLEAEIIGDKLVRITGRKLKKRLGLL